AGPRRSSPPSTPSPQRESEVPNEFPTRDAEARVRAASEAAPSASTTIAVRAGDRQRHGPERATEASAVTAAPTQATTRRSDCAPVPGCPWAGEQTGRSAIVTPDLVVLFTKERPTHGHRPR